MSARIFRLSCLLATLAGACSSTDGVLSTAEQLGFMPCDQPFECGVGRYCSEQGFCTADCRTSADCREFCRSGRCSRSAKECRSDQDCPQDKICTLYGKCDSPGGGEECTSHADCPRGHFCNGRCSGSGAACGGDEACPLGGACQGTCSSSCGNDNDCLTKNLSCTPVAQCLQEGWEKWIPAGELPPTACRRDSQCKSLGWRWYCNCEKELDPRTGWQVCRGGATSTCARSEKDLDFGAGPQDSPAHDFIGVWGMRMEIAVITVGLPLINRQNTYSSNLILVKIDHPQGDRLVLQEKICEIKLINFVDSDEPFEDIAWMLVPSAYLHSLPILEQTVSLSSASKGAPFETSQSLEVRGAILKDPLQEPLPVRADYLADPQDARFFDQDEDGQVGMTTFMDGVLRGRIYNVQRWKAIYHGEILDRDHIRGLATIENEQKVISASTSALIYETTSEMHPQADRTYFRMQRLAPDASCADLIREAGHQDSWLRHTPHMMDVPDPQ